MTTKLSEENRDALIDALQKELDTRDKRYMFLRTTFKKILPHINIEGSPHDAAWNIYFEFEKQCMLGSLMACMNSLLDCDLYLDI